uniref:Uncharacterized protein n=1 Tax=Anguilla anguilla TaxID=7936 RepID=A0A0E9VB38_ANGAN
MYNGLPSPQSFQKTDLDRTVFFLSIFSSSLPPSVSLSIFWFFPFLALFPLTPHYSD